MSTKRKPAPRLTRKPQPAPPHGLNRDEVALIAWHAILVAPGDLETAAEVADMAFIHADAFIRRSQQ